MGATFTYPASSPMSLEMALSLLSVMMTAYFWLVKSRRERANLKIFQLREFRPTLRRGDPQAGTRRLCLMQLPGCGVLVANNSSRQNSIVRFDCFLKQDGGWLKGVWGYVDDDMPPWNIGPESTISLALACFFDVPEDYEIPEAIDFRVEFITASGQRFGHLFHRDAPQL